LLNLSNVSNSYQWYVNDSLISNQYHSFYVFNDSGWFKIKLIAKNQFDCFDTAIKNLFVRDIVSVFIPNVFTPNKDLYNELFFPVTTGIASWEIEVYNRWGQKIFTGNENINWDGTHNGVNVPEGIYMYQIKLITIDKKRIFLNGVVNVLR
jgi:gliding motility-associated-like protein